MAQHDYVIANGTGAAVRSDLNNALAAIVSQNSGATEPATMYAYQWWADTSTGLLKLRNAANNAWITLRELDGTLTIEDGTASSPGLAFADDLNTGIYSPSADQLGITTGGTVRLTTTTTGITSALPVDVPLGTASAPTVTFTGDLNTGIYSPGADQVAISTNGVERVEWGTSEVVFNDGGANYDFRIEGDTNSSLFFVDASAEAVGIGTTSPVATTHCAGSFFSTSRSVPSSGVGPELCYDTGDSKSILLSYNRTSSAYVPISIGGSQVELATGGTERARIDSSGRLLVGTSSVFDTNQSGTNASVAIEKANGYATLALKTNQDSTNGAYLLLGKARGTSANSKTLVSNGDEIGAIYFEGADGSAMRTVAGISVTVDGATGASDIPSRLALFTTADGASSATERIRIGNAGHTWFNSSDFTTLYPGEGNTATGFFVEANGKVAISRDNTNPLVLNRKTSDGTIVDIRQDGTSEGSISVSGTTVSYNGAHLSRWSQIPGIDPHDKDARPEILRGTVMSNLDEMCDWIDPETDEPQDNEQLNKTKVSDVEGDKNVAGIFQSWDDDDDTWVNDYYLAMTGDFIIRIGAGVTVERGDLLMSAGDGTAKPQDDDIIRSKTIAKVTSTNVSCTYDDGSYCVPCVLMAC